MKDVREDDVLSFLNEVTATAARKIMSYYLGEFRIDSKDQRVGGIDIVTDADRASEELIIESISRSFPGHDILTEESSRDRSGSRWLWVVDPLDGTVNYAHGYPVFAVSIALTDNEIPLVGMIYDPIRDERFWAVRGRGAFCNGEAIRVSAADRMDRSLVATGFPYDRAYSSENNLAEFSKVVNCVQGLRRGGSAALDLAYVACGRLDGFWELKLKPWDMAAGMLLVSEAGGRVTDRFARDTDIFTTSIVATNGLIHDLLIGLLAG